MRNLQELTGQESGIVIYNEKDGILCNWANINGFPRIFATGLIGFGEEIPEVEGKLMDISRLLENVSIDVRAHYTAEELPKSGTVYQINDEITVIAPDGWA